MSSAAEQRQAVADLTSLARRELDAFWRMLPDDLNAEQVRDALMDVLPELGGAYGDAAAALAADWYEDVREASQARGSFSPVLASPPEPARWEALARWGVDPLFAEQPDAATALAKVAGGLQRSIADQHRLTVVESSIADPAASGWRRVARAGACGFCKVLADRRSDGENGVYTEASVQFKSHDNCACCAAPSFASNVRKVIGVPYVASKRNVTDRDRERVRDYLKGQD